MIDILRIDLNGHEWDIINKMTIESSLVHVKQLIVHIHTKEYPVAIDRVTTVSDFVLYWHILDKLEVGGFRLWKSVEMEQGLYKSTRSKYNRPSCVKLHFINTYFLW